MKQQQPPIPPNDYGISSIFPIPLYSAKRDTNLDSSEKKDIEDIIEEGTFPDALHSFSQNSYIFNTKLKKLKEFCEKHIQNYVKEVINPKEEVDFYITQSWLNVTRPGEGHTVHSHANSIISGAFYIQTEVGQTIDCYDPNQKIKEQICIHSQGMANFWNADTMSSIVKENMLLLFPSWLSHGVKPNEQQTKDVISLSFNSFVRGSLGDEENKSQLIL